MSHCSYSTHEPPSHDQEFLAPYDHHEFEVSRYLNFENESEGDLLQLLNIGDCTQNQNPNSFVEDVDNSMPADHAVMLRSGELVGGHEVGCKIAIRTKSEHEILDDGYRWRKYGKKQVKNSPYPRNYYRCSNRECPVKKTVQRDKKDASYVTTTYAGKHNHQNPSTMYVTSQHKLGLSNSSQMRLMESEAWNMDSPHQFP